MGDPITITITVTVNGTVPATGTTVTYRLPATFSLTSVSPSQGSCRVAGARITCSLGTLASDGTATIAVKATPTVAGTYDSTVTASSTKPDPYPADNSTKLHTLVGAPGCGRSITANTKLSADLGPCPAAGLVVSRNGVTLDLGGHRVFGFSGKTDVNAVGIVIPGRTRAVVQRSRVDATVVDRCVAGDAVAGGPGRGDAG